ncbi:MAG: hypothetical protein EBU84_18435 [Actinobacteria bacterium]|nr:hypothetical protein [Actinomycetota bacterium]
MDELVNATFVGRVARSTDPFISTDATTLIAKFAGRCLKETLKHASAISQRKTLLDSDIRNASFDLCAVYPVPMSNPGSRKRTRTGKPAVEGQATAADEGVGNGQEPDAAATDEGAVNDPPTVDVLAMEY